MPWSEHLQNSKSCRMLPVCSGQYWPIVIQRRITSELVRGSCVSKPHSCMWRTKSSLVWSHRSAAVAQIAEKCNVGHDRQLPGDMMDHSLLLMELHSCRPVTVPLLVLILCLIGIWMCFCRDLTQKQHTLCMCVLSNQSSTRRNMEIHNLSSAVLPVGSPIHKCCVSCVFKPLDWKPLTGFKASLYDEWV